MQSRGTDVTSAAPLAYSAQVLNQSLHRAPSEPLIYPFPSWLASNVQVGYVVLVQGDGGPMGMARPLRGRTNKTLHYAPICYL